VLEPSPLHEGHCTHHRALRHIRRVACEPDASRERCFAICVF
jgi:hypothetical protein